MNLLQKRAFLYCFDPLVKLVIEKEFPGNRCVGGKYSAADHSITLYKRDIEIQCRELLGSLDELEAYSWIVLAHELGHALDPALPALSEQLGMTGDPEVLYLIECNAWNLAQQMIPFVPQELFETVRSASLDNCTNRLVAV